MDQQNLTPTCSPDSPAQASRPAPLTDATMPHGHAGQGAQDGPAAGQDECGSMLTAP